MKKEIKGLVKFTSLLFLTVFATQTFAVTSLEDLGGGFGYEAYKFLSGGGGVVLMVLSIFFGVLAAQKGAGILGIVGGVIAAALIGYSPDLIISFTDIDAASIENWKLNELGH